MVGGSLGYRHTYTQASFANSGEYSLEADFSSSFSGPYLEIRASY